LRRTGVVAALCLIAGTTADTASASSQADPVQTFRNLATGGCLDHNNIDGVRAYPCNGGAWQQWSVHVWGDSTRQLRNVATGKCLDYSELGGDTIVGSPCNTSTSESWYVLYQGVGGIAFKNQFSGRCLSANSGYMHLSSCDPNDRAESWS
jgi:hypothetical protein